MTDVTVFQICYVGLYHMTVMAVRKPCYPPLPKIYFSPSFDMLIFSPYGLFVYLYFGQFCIFHTLNFNFLSSVLFLSVLNLPFSLLPFPYCFPRVNGPIFPPHPFLLCTGRYVIVVGAFLYSLLDLWMRVLCVLAGWQRGGEAGHTEQGRL